MSDYYEVLDEDSDDAGAWVDDLRVVPMGTARQIVEDLLADRDALVRYVRAYRNSNASEAIEAYEALSQELRDLIGG